MKKIRYFCSNCGSTDIVWDAWASWNEEKQVMELENTFDDCFCNECEQSSKEVSEEEVETE